MNFRVLRLLILSSALCRRLAVRASLAAAVGMANLPGAAGGESKVVDFRRDVYPILAAHCFRCHEGNDPESGVRLDQHAVWLGQKGAAALVKPGQSRNSLAIELVRSASEKRMPPAGPRLNPRQIGVLEAWIDGGLRWDDALLPPADPARHWAFQPIRRPPIPVAGQDWSRNPIDAFVVRRQIERGLNPQARAAPRTLMRRLYLVLLGLPPTPLELDQFAADAAPDAYERLVERVLASPAYGERWGRHWLDVARWAESEGYESNHPRAFAWRYRDWVIDSFNADLPYDRFLREQIAGDEMQPYRDEQLIATGFLAAARLSSNEEDKWLQRNDVLVDIVNATSAAVLGLTMNCCQCHDHKFDPLSQRDYYRFQGFFVRGQPANLSLRDARLWDEHKSARPQEYAAARELLDTLYRSAQCRKIDEIKRTLPAETLRVLAIPSDQRSWAEEQVVRQANLKFQFTPNGFERAIPEADRKLYNELKKKVADIESKIPPVPQTWGFFSPVTSPADVDVLPTLGFYPLPYEPDELARARPYLLERGEIGRRGERLTAGWPQVLAWNADEPPPPDSVQSSTRSALVDWLVDRRHALTARVWVNRLWQHNFGRGLVATPSNFGLRGAKPTHPDLLDWLASELLDHDFSTKQIQRLIVTSATFTQNVQLPIQQATAMAAQHEIDPENRFLWTWRPRRLEAEAIRDLTLATSGQLEWRMHGKSVAAVESKQATAEQAAARLSGRRSIYLRQTRDRPPEAQSLFDGPVGMTASCAKRMTSTTALQPLFLLNSRFSQTQAQHLARRVMHETGSASLDRWIERATELTTGRRAIAADQQAAREFFQAVAADGDPQSDGVRHALELYCQTLLNVNEFLYIP